MLRYLLDENISPKVADAVLRANATIGIESIYRWHGGQMSGAADPLLLKRAHGERLTLVTYDLQTIPDLLAEWAEEGTPHSGVVFVDATSIAGNDFGGLARALVHLWKQSGRLNWLNRPVFLNRR